VKHKLFIFTFLLLVLFLPLRAYAQSRTITVDFGYKFILRGKTSKVRFVVLIPGNRKYRQRIFKVKFSRKPHRVFERYGNRYAEFIILNPKKDFDINIRVRMQISRYDLSTARNYMTKPEKNEQIEPYLRAEKYLEKNNPVIRNLARSIHGDNEIEIVNKAHRLVTRRMKYGGYIKNDVGAVKAYSTGSGDCTEYSDLLVALCRAKDIPARAITGYVINNKGDTPRHNWVEAYFKQYGWVPFDPLHADDKAATFYRLKPIYIYLSSIRNDRTLLNGNFYRYWWTGPRVDIKESFKVR